MRPFRSLASIVPLACAAALLAGCSDDTMDVEMHHYQIAFQPLNAQVAGNVSAMGEITVTGDRMDVTIHASGLDDTLHPQHIHVVDACPTAASDANGDGYVDVIEGAPSYGLILVPLDGDLSSQSAGSTVFPSGSTYDYEESVSMATMVADLQVADPDGDDPVVKLDAGASLDLTGRSMVIHGVSDELPGSVAGLAGLPGNVVLPVACGTIVAD